ncbi:hypothetical protein RHMOL_Rhmol04G0332900 [Rhododendron molle]|uniref:Uncharacterized protein n=1 Tax=Rhododendron molle TaxID=49168 RepID=A0ACC0P7G5_RHOML|nr:hypothetical protein RHMOL_Rhmol04G0332900 [Rhododendron molle]
MYSLKAAMKWDEDVRILFHALTTRGAIENKSLNIFNSKLVLASPESAIDADYAAILGVIGHEEFSSDMGSRTVKRIADVSRLRNYQFPQDAGPLSHHVRPHSYIKMDNFYTGKFGTISAVQGSDTLKQSEEHKRKARAERFGLAQSVTADEEAKKKARLSRFGTVPAVPKANAQDEDKKKARALRYVFAVGSKRI